jgi:hypothetical protein
VCDIHLRGTDECSEYGVQSAGQMSSRSLSRSIPQGRITERLRSAFCWSVLVMELHILSSCIVPCLPKLCSTTASSPAGWKGNQKGLHELYSMILESKSIIQTNKHRSTYFFAEDVLHRPSDFEVKASAVKTKNARLYKAGI